MKSFKTIIIAVAAAAVIVGGSFALTGCNQSNTSSDASKATASAETQSVTESQAEKNSAIEGTWAVTKYTIDKKDILKETEEVGGEISFKFDDNKVYMVITVGNTSDEDELGPYSVNGKNVYIGPETNKFAGILSGKTIKINNEKNGSKVIIEMTKKQAVD